MMSKIRPLPTAYNRKFRDLEPSLNMSSKSRKSIYIKHFYTFISRPLTSIPLSQRAWDNETYQRVNLLVLVIPFNYSSAAEQEGVQRP